MEEKHRLTFRRVQPPSGGCVLKQPIVKNDGSLDDQPPSGGCVLKRPAAAENINLVAPAAFRRLCVETVKGALR